MSKGFLSCGYINFDSANEWNEAVAIVTGVKKADEMLSSKIVKVSNKAIKLGINIGDLGRNALLKLRSLNRSLSPTVISEYKPKLIAKNILQEKRQELKFLFESQDNN